MSDINLLRALSDRKRFVSLYPSTTQVLLDSNTRALLDWFKLYFNTYQEHDCIDVDNLSSFIRLKGNLNQEQMLLIGSILGQLKTPIDDPVVLTTTLNSLEERRLSEIIQSLCKKYDEGLEVDLVYEVNKFTTDTKLRMETQHEAKWADGDVFEYMKAAADDSGYKLDFLPDEFYSKIRGLNAGHNVCIAARTNKGKTAFLSKLAVSFAKQHKVFLERTPEMEFRPILYLVNEGTAESITTRIYQSAFECSLNELWEFGAKGTITDKYVAIVGRRDAIRCVNVHGKTQAQVSRIIEAHKPFCVITDMTGRIRLTGTAANDVQQLEEVWDGMRVLAAMQDFIHVGTAQISAEGTNMLFPPLSAIQNSKTGLQTTLDLGIWLGAYDDPTPENANIRGLSTPKSKLAISGCNSEIQLPCYFDPERNTWSKLLT